MSERVVAVVVHYADRILTERCVASFLESGIGVVVVDNEATDEGPLVEVGPGSELICPGRNLGYGAGANLGLGRAFERAPFALVVNNDITLSSQGFAAELAGRLEADPTIGIAGPLVLAPDGTPQPTVERWPSLRLALALARHGYGTQLPTEQTDVEAVNGVCMLLSRSVFEATGGFDERYFLYAEELDLCRRAADAGYRTVFVPIPSVVHHHLAGEERPDAARLIRVNFVRFCRDHGSLLSAFLAALLFLVSATVRRRDPVALARGIGRALFGGESVVDRLLIPGTVALWVFMLALGSSYSQPLREVGKAGKFGLLVVLIAIEAPRIVGSPRRYLRELEPRFVHSAALVFVAFGASSALWSTDPRHSLLYAATLGLLFLALLLGPWRIALRRQGREDLLRGVLVGWGVVVVATVLALGVFGHQAIFRAPGAPRRLRGFFESPDEIAAYVLVAPLAYWWIFERGGRRSRFLRAIGLITLLGFVVELAFSGNRTGAALLVLTFAVYLVAFLRGARAAFGVLAATALASVAALLWVISPTFSTQAIPSILRPASLSTLGGRTQAWSAARTLIGQRPAGGFGLGTEPDAIANYRTDGDRLYNECIGVPLAPGDPCDTLVSRARRLIDFQGGNVHNSYLSVGIELGYVALFPFVVALLLWTYQLARSLRRADGLGAALFASVVAGLGWAFFSTFLINPGNLVTGIFWLLIVIGLAAGREPRVDV